MSKFEVGQEVILVEGFGQRSPVEVEVVKVGRTLVYIKHHGQEKAFYQKDGVERRSPNAVGYGDRVYTLEQWADRERRAAAIKRLSDLAVVPLAYSPWRCSTDALEQVIAVLEADLEKGA
ncbi:beta barrel domain-containing protein [Microbacterium sp. No. 7]|uniref:beta barrel domain-containing protein n=1 Tax=Microbacterium sp. No. 7 TaxID=1714373 RepID=UPI0006D13DCA|nr:hypothetical protein [Microbacterium sp. No. 7]ALJ19543.1 hypothetical protein AOA12_06315 [Microbacterium sp. No. 7]